MALIGALVSLSFIIGVLPMIDTGVFPGTDCLPREKAAFRDNVFALFRREGAELGTKRLPIIYPRRLSGLFRRRC